MNVRDIMQPAQTVNPETRVTDIARLLLSSGLRGLPVLASDGTIAGMITERDVVAKHARIHTPLYLGILGGLIPFEVGRTEDDLRHVLSVTASDLMSEHVRTLSPDAEIDDAARVMVDHDVDPVLVVENSSLVGIVTQADILRLLIVEETDDAAESAS